MTDIQVTHIEVGVAMVPADLDTLPTGTVISSNLTSPHRYTRRADGFYVENGTERRHNWEAFGNGYVVVSYPEDVEVRPMGTTDYKWKFRNVTLRAAHSHSVSVSAVVQALSEMGAGLDALPLREGQVLANAEDVDALPEGTLVQAGRIDSFESFGLFRVHNGGTQHVLGGRRAVQRDNVRVAELPAEYTPPEVDEDEAALNAFKVKAYVIGLKVKGAQDWCSTYEAIVAPLGITADAIRPLVSGNELLGTKVNAEGAAALPVGTILSWQNAQHTACSWFVRVEQAGNKAGTRRIFAHADEGVTGRPGHFSNSMTVAWLPLPEDQASIPGVGLLNEVQGFDVFEHFEYLPPGTVISWRATTFYLIHRDGRASQHRYVPGQLPALRANGEYGRDSFGSPSDLRIVSFPHVLVAQPEVSDDQPF